MKRFFSIVLLVMGSHLSLENGRDRTVTTQQYQLDGDFNKVHASGHIQVELTPVDSEPSVRIETEQWVHDSGVTVSTKSNDGLHLKLENGVNYPPIKVYVNYRTPLIGLKTSGASSMTSTNFIRSDPSSPLNLGHSGSSTAALKLQHGSNLVADISGSSQVNLSGRIQGDGRLSALGASQVDLSGQVQGNGQLSVGGAAKLSAIKCEIMKIAETDVSGSGKASVYGVKGVRARASGASTIYYRGNLVEQHTEGASKIMPYPAEGIRAEV